MPGACQSRASSFRSPELTDDLELLKPLGQPVFLILRCFWVVVRKQRVLEGGHFKLAGVELLEDGPGEAEVVIEHGYFERPCHIDRLVILTLYLKLRLVRS